MLRPIEERGPFEGEPPRTLPGFHRKSSTAYILAVCLHPVVEAVGLRDAGALSAFQALARQTYRLASAGGVPGLNCAGGEERHWTRRAYGTREEVSLHRTQGESVILWGALIAYVTLNGDCLTATAYRDYIPTNRQTSSEILTQLWNYFPQISNGEAGTSTPPLSPATACAGGVAITWALSQCERSW